MPVAFGGLVGLLAGFLLGLGLTAVPTAATATIVGIFATAGGIFIDLIRMTMLPLVTTLLVSGLGSLDGSRGLGRAGARAVVSSAILLAGAIALALVVAPPLLARVDIDRDAAIALRNASTAPTGGGPTTLPTVAQWVRGLVPPNVVRAAADDVVLSVVIFAVLFGLALSKLAPEKRDPVLGVVTGMAAAMQRLVGGLLKAAPFGIFALAVPMAAGLGVSAATAVLAYIALVVALTLGGVILVLYPVAVATGQLSMAAFATYCAPAQALAFTSRSSLAALPSMLDSAERAGLPARAQAILPIALSTFHFGAGIAQTVGALFIARIYDVELGPTQLATTAVATFFASIAVPGVPGGSIIAIAPVLIAANLPPEGLGILLAVDTVPDMFRTVANVTGAMAVTASAVSTDD